jgi:hypothetical protein
MSTYYKHYATVNTKDELDVLYTAIDQVNGIELTVDELNDRDEHRPANQGGPYVTVFMTSKGQLDEQEYGPAIIAATIDHEFNREFNREQETDAQKRG